MAEVNAEYPFVASSQKYWLKHLAQLGWQD